MRRASNLKRRSPRPPSGHTGKEGTEARHGSERWANRAAFSEATDLFRFRVIPGVSVTTDLALLCDGDRFEITSVEDVKGRGMYLEVMAKVVKPGG